MLEKERRTVQYGKEDSVYYCPSIKGGKRKLHLNKKERG